MTDVFLWKMNASAHSESIDKLRDLIIESFNSGSSLPVGLIADLLPIQGDNISQLHERGDFLISNENFINQHEENVLQLKDPVIGEYTLYLPQKIGGSYKQTGHKSFKITFDDLIEIEIPKISDFGINRSSFQIITEIRSSLETTITVLKDVIDSDKHIWIDARLSKSNDIIKKMRLEIDDEINVVEFDTKNQDCSGNDVEEENWYVVRVLKGVDTYCIVKFGFVSSPTLMYIAGPGTKQQMIDLKPSICGEK